MKPNKRNVLTMLLAGCLLAQVTITGCAARVGVGYRVYDPYHSDYHHFDDHERVFYNQWTVETHKAPDREFRKMNRDDRNAYWNWRHDHPDQH
jgi:hypothetical protein